MFNRGPVQKDSFFSAYTVGIKTELYEAAEPISAGDFVGITFAQGVTKVYQADASTEFVVGIATETVVAGANLRVQTKGFFETANVATASTQGKGVGKTSTAGQAALVTAHDQVIVAVALANAVDNVAPVVIL